ncbi:MAG: AzlC family ABC transporter permease [Clostridia bacterium]|nr:AzlC family ABC transporter permease [Clostridia bacterium]
MRSKFVKGMADGMPIALGYLSVSFGFGILAVKAGLSVLAAVGISLTNLTSAGQAAGIGIIAAGGTLIEMILTQLVINLRYSLMAVSLTQKLDGSFHTPQRMLVAFGITDEIYAVAMAQKEPLTPRYMQGLIFTPLIGWTTGTFLGGMAAGQLLPPVLSDALGLMLYGMFIAIIIPPCKKSHPLIAVILIAAGFSVLFTYATPFISGGFAVILSALITCILAAFFFPIKEEKA